MIFFILLTSLAISIYIYGTRTHKYWLERGVKHDKPLPFIGNNLDNYLMKKSCSEIACEIYFKYPKEKIVGFYRSNVPEIVVRDPGIIKAILTTDFTYFHLRGLNMHKEVIEPLLKNLFFADGDLWRLLRQRMTPAFSSGKLKAMLPLICDRANRLQSTVDAAITNSNCVLDAREIMARYTTDFIGSVGFGLDIDSLNDINSTFRRLGRDIFRVPFRLFLTIVLKEIFPELCKHLKYMYLVEKDLIKLVTDIQKQRDYKPSGRNDFIDLLLECKNKGIMVGESIENTKPDGRPEITSIELNDELFAAQVFIFFAAGFETSSTSTGLTLHQLAYHPKIQEKVQQNIDQVLAKYNDKLCYEAIKEMTYLDWAFKETMRIFPSVGFLARECAKTYTFRDLGVTIDAGVKIVIPLQALHNDPQYFKNPEVFEPERFNPEDSEVNRYVYMPFGCGPRACIGERLGYMQSIAGLAAVLSRFSVEPAPDSVRVPKVDPLSPIIQSIKGGLPLVFKRRKCRPRY